MDQQWLFIRFQKGMSRTSVIPGALKLDHIVLNAVSRDKRVKPTDSMVP